MVGNEKPNGFVSKKQKEQENSIDQSELILRGGELISCPVGTTGTIMTAASEKIFKIGRSFRCRGGKGSGSSRDGTQMKTSCAGSKSSKQGTKTMRIKMGSLGDDIRVA